MVVGVGRGSQRLLSLNLTTVMVVLLFGLWLLLGCEEPINYVIHILLSYFVYIHIVDQNKLWLS